MMSLPDDEQCRLIIAILSTVKAAFKLTCQWLKNQVPRKNADVR
jgi:hypothetical protein